MEKSLLFIKHNLAFLWQIIEWINEKAFSIFYNSKMSQISQGVLEEFSALPFTYRKLLVSDTKVLSSLIASQDKLDLKYFNPHPFDEKSILKKLRSTSFLMMGVYDKRRLVGYFFLRFFLNKKCFVGRLIDKAYRHKGIGAVMNNILYETSWRMSFRCLSTISEQNEAVMNAHAKNKNMIVLKKLQNDYLLVEFVKEK